MTTMNFNTIYIYNLAGVGLGLVFFRVGGAECMLGNQEYNSLAWY